MKNKIQIALPLLLLLAINLMLYLSYDRNVKSLQEDAKQIFIHHAEKHVGSFQKLIDLSLNTAESMVAFFYASHFVSRDEFKMFGEKILETHSEIQSINWIAPVAHKDRKSYEEKIQRQGYSDFTIHNAIFNNGQLTPANQQNDYYPIHFLVPFAENKSVFGFDVSQDVIVSLALEQAISTQLFSMSAPLTLVQETGAQKGIVFMLPVYKESLIQGFVQLVLRMGDVKNLVIQKHELDKVSINTLFDITTNVHQEIVADTLPTPIETTLFSYQKIWDIGGRQWQFSFTPSVDFIDQYQGKKQAELIRLVFKVLLSFLVTYIIYYIIRQKNKAESSRSQLESAQDSLISQKNALDEHAIVSITDASGKITYANEKFQQICQYTEQELLGKDHRLMNSGYHSKSFFKSMREHIKNGDVWEGIIRNKAKDGAFFWVETTIVPFLDKKGCIEKYVVIRTDISSIKALELGLKDVNRLLLKEVAQSEQEKQRFEMLFEKSADGQALMENGVFTSVNIQAVKMLGYHSKQELLKSPDQLSPYYQPDGQVSVVKAKQMMEKCMTESSHRFEWVHCKEDGAELWVDVSLTRLDYLNKQLIHVSWRDISSQKQLEIDNERAKDQALKANKAKSEFLSSMSHELRTPLNAILGFSQLLDTNEEEPLSELQKESVNYILSSGEHLLNLINDVLELASIESGKTELAIEPLLLNDAINNAISLLTPVANKANISIHVLSDLACIVNADRTKLQQVIFNLITNAIKYNSTDGSVSVDWKKNNQFVRISIVDTGIGISEANKNKIFVAFNRLGQEMSTIEGTGIGLVVTKDLVEMMGGEIGFDSIENKGTSFWFELPLVEEEYC